MQRRHPAPGGRRGSGGPRDCQGTPTLSRFGGSEPKLGPDLLQVAQPGGAEDEPEPGSFPRAVSQLLQGASCGLQLTLWGLEGRADLTRAWSKPQEHSILGGHRPRGGWQHGLGLEPGIQGEAPSKQKGRATKGQSERTLTGSLVFIFLYPCSCVILGKLLNLSGPEAPHLEVNALVISTSSQCYCVKKTSVLSAPLSDSF